MISNASFWTSLWKDVTDKGVRDKEGITEVAVIASCNCQQLVNRGLGPKLLKGGIKQRKVLVEISGVVLRREVLGSSNYLGFEYSVILSFVRAIQ